ncbi:hypothetical protein [Pandoravirus japonicus]|uniref:Uncharacterized protein n=1 Tax=Pandoravirus japonicus TaxID=2823154 RepID=A0A811BRM3_9VIRU|nr:hypothetical protein [Pandoravirus japonicus]
MFFFFSFFEKRLVFMSHKRTKKRDVRPFSDFLVDQRTPDVAHWVRAVEIATAPVRPAGAASDERATRSNIPYGARTPKPSARHAPWSCQRRAMSSTISVVTSATLAARNSSLWRAILHAVDQRTRAHIRAHAQTTGESGVGSQVAPDMPRALGTSKRRARPRAR